MMRADAGVSGQLMPRTSEKDGENSLNYFAWRTLQTSPIG